MALKTPKKASPEKRRINFSFSAKDAEAVFLVGNFNQWNESSHPMKKDGSGVWKKAVMLAPGVYEYKFLVDGQWQNDPENQDCCDNTFGTTNSRIRVD